MKSRLSFLIAFALVLLCASPVFADNVQTDYDHGVNFSQFQTYSWGQVKTVNPFYVDRIKGQVDQILQAAGWKLVPSGGNVVVFATDNVHNQKELETTYNGFGDGWGFGWGWGGWGWGGPGFGDSSTQTTYKQPVGKLVVDMFDGGSKKLLWRGMATGDLSNNSDKNNKNLAKDIAKMLKDFPPKAKG